MDSWVPLAGSGIDSIAQQRQGYMGMNQSTELANMAAAQRAAEERNAYIYNQQQLQAAAQQRAQQLAADNAARQQSAYQFQANLAANEQGSAADIALKQRQLDAGIAADKAANDAARYAARLAKASQEAQAGTFDPVNYTDLKPEDLAYLNRITAPQRKVQQQTAANAGDLAGKLNQHAAYDKTLSKGAPSNDQYSGSYFTGLIPAGIGTAGVGLMAAGAGVAGAPVTVPTAIAAPITAPVARWAGRMSVAAPDTSWFSALQSKQNAVDQSLRAAGITFTPDGAVQLPKGTTLEDYGLTYDTKSGQYKRVPTTWDGFGQGAAAPANTVAPNLAAGSLTLGSGQPQMVKVISPDGVSGSIPIVNLKGALAAGYRLAQ